MPLLFALTLFVSASLLFMVQPMVGKMVLPLLGGSPAVWNACMVFFQALLLLGYLYAHHVSGKYSARKQWAIHMVVLGLPLAAFGLAIMFGARQSPIAIAESLAPTGERSPILSVLALLTVAIGIPFFVVATSAPLLQKWFTATGHPSARDPYFLYSASNAGSLISLLGYPIVIEPNLTIVGQAWLFAGGFALLVVMVFFCGRAAANPIGVPPGATDAARAAAATPVNAEPPPTVARKLKWIALAFVPSSLMLGVTFHMTTDIASIPLLWVIPLALYLITFIIAFGRVPDGFRIVIGNLAPVMILLLVFVMISGVSPGVGIELLLHILTFFAVALMCHYELARDRPSPQYLTEFFLLMSVGGVLGGIFNSLLAPVIFPQSYEYRVALLIGCLMVPRLLTDDKDEKGNPLPSAEPQLSTRQQLQYTILGALLAPLIVLAELAYLILNIGRRVAPGTTPIATTTAAKKPMAKPVDPHDPLAPRASPRPGISTAIALVLALIGGSVFLFVGTEFPAKYTALLVVLLFLVAARPILEPFAGEVRDFFVGLGQERRSALLDGAIPMAILGLYVLLRQWPGETWFVQTAKGAGEGLNLPINTVMIVMLFAVPVMVCFFFVDRPVRFALCVTAILGYTAYRDSSSRTIHSERSFFGILKIEADTQDLIISKDRKPILGDDGKPLIAGSKTTHRLVHGTTLHGIQHFSHNRHILDDFQMLTMNAWDAVAVSGAIHAYDLRLEPLTYYHLTGPVGASFRELRTRKGGSEEKAPFAMVGLGTGSASCYALPGQEITFYEIDPAVKHLVADTDKYFTYVNDARRRGAIMDIRMGDARLKLKEDTDKKYALLLVDAFSSDSIPVHLLTVEAVQLYLDRMTPDGILMLHISNKFVQLEPVVAAIANKLGLVARVWNDNRDEDFPGKTASSWVVLARKKEDLGKLFSPIGDIVFGRPVEPGKEDRLKVDLANQIAAGLVEDYESELTTTKAGKAKYKELNEAEDAKPGAWLAWVEQKLASTTDPWEKERLTLYADLLRRFGPHKTFQYAMLHDLGHAFRRLETREQVHAWTDDYSDVMRVMMIPELQKLRKLFGLPTPLIRN